MFFSKSLSLHHQKVRARAWKGNRLVSSAAKSVTLRARVRCGLPFEGLLWRARALLFLSLGFIYILEEEEAPPRAFQIYFEERKRKRAHLFKRPRGAFAVYIFR